MGGNKPNLTSGVEATYVKLRSEMASSRFDPIRPLEGHLRRFEEEFAFGPLVRKLFRSAGADPIFAGPAPVGISAPPGSWVLHVRLPPRLEETFGFTREFVVYCLKVDDFQSRTVTQLKRLIESAEHSVANDFAMVVICDPLATEKVRDWAIDRSDGLAVLPVDPRQLDAIIGEGDPGQALPRLLDRALTERNLYDDRTPVRGEHFFGRGDELRELDRIISQGHRHIGVFGLRRIGKTSLLLELADRLRRRKDVTPVFIDLELSSATDSAAHVAHRIGNAVAYVMSERTTLSEQEARRALGIPDVWDEIDPRRLIADFGVKLVDVLTKGALADTRLVLMLDEAEILLPNPSEPVQDTVDLLRMIRGVSQESERLTLILAGVNATSCESPVLGAEDNPLFGLLALKYLGPLEHAACEDMIRIVGRNMRLRWDPAARKAVTDYVGAHPLLARLAASDVANMYEERPLRPNLQMVQRVLVDFHRRNSDIFVQMLQSLKRYYPEELEVLKLLGTGETDFVRELVDHDATLLNHLAGYGVVDRNTLGISVPAFAAWLRIHPI